MLEVDGLRVRYGLLQALFDVRLRVAQGEIVTIVGANAAGKTTLINAVSGVLDGVRGALTFEGRSIERVPAYDRAERGIVQVPEGRRLFPTMSVLENLEMGAYTRRARAGRRERLAEVFELLPLLAERRHQAAGSLSGGEQQMCAIGRGLMAAPRLLMLDEPSLGLAPLMVQRVFEIVRAVNARGVTVLLVEQNVQHALSLAHRGYVLESGRIVLEGRGADLLADPALRRAYMGME